MDEYESLSHSKWECKYHVVFIPKCRCKTLYEQLRKHLGEVFRRLAEQKERAGSKRVICCAIMCTC
jgi:putative transposase